MFQTLFWKYLRKIYPPPSQPKWRLKRVKCVRWIFLRVTLNFLFVNFGNKSLRWLPSSSLLEVGAATRLRSGVQVRGKFPLVLIAAALVISVSPPSLFIFSTLTIFLPFNCCWSVFSFRYQPYWRYKESLVETSGFRKPPTTTSTDWCFAEHISS